MDVSCLNYFEALASGTRLEIIRLLSIRDMNIKELAEALDISSSIMTKHVRKLESARIITTTNVSKDGSRNKMCSLVHAVTEVHPPVQGGFLSATGGEYHCNLPVGLYTGLSAEAPCGLANASHLIGSADFPPHLFSAERANAQLLWLSKGYVEYTAPNDLVSGQTLHSLTLSGEFGTINEDDPPANIALSINGVPICQFTALGVLHPGQWPFHRHGILTVIRIDADGVFVNGEQKAHDILSRLPLAGHWVIRLECAESFALFGEQCGANPQHLRLVTTY